MDDDDEEDKSLSCGNLAPRKGAIIVGDAVVEINTSLDKVAGSVLAVCGEGVAPAQAEIGA